MIGMGIFWRSVFVAMAAGAPPIGGVTMAVTAHYVDTAGVRQSVVLAADGSTVINVREFGNVVYDLTASRSTDPNCNTEGGAYHNMGFRAKYVGVAAGNWPFNGDTSTRTIGQEWGQPVFIPVYSVIGSGLTTFAGRDSTGAEGTISCTVNVSAYTSTVAVSAAGGVWPSWASNTKYTLSGDYSAFPAITTWYGGGDTSGLHNIAFVGTGSTPVPAFQPDGRNNVSTGVVTRSAGIRLVDCSTTRFSYGYVGYDFCIAYRCTVGSYGMDFGSTDYGFGQAIINARGSVVANNIRHPFGGGCVLSTVHGDTYVYILSGRGMVFQGCTLDVDVGVKEHVFRPYNALSVLRNNLMDSSLAAGLKSWIKGAALSSSYTAVATEWRSDDAAGDYAAALALFTTYGATYAGDPTRNLVGGIPQPDNVILGYGYQSKNNAFEWNQLGTAAHPVANSVAGAGPQNNDDWNRAAPYTTNGSYELCSFSAIENNRTYAAVPFTDTEIQLSGYHMGARGNTTNMGAGAALNVGTSAGPRKTPPGYDGPYYTTGSRPVPSAIT